MSSFLGLCMIVKDEENVLRRCLDSVHHVVDEIVIVDTGSSDSTAEIAREYTDKIYHFRWNDNFAEARNFAQSKSRAQWILVLDADEYVEEENLRHVISQLKTTVHPADAYTATIYNFAGGGAESVFQHRSLRLYRNDGQIYFDRAIHEQLVKSEGELLIGESDLVIYHTGYMAQAVKAKDKHQRNMHLLSKERDRSGENPFDDFNLGNEYMGKRQFDKALDAYLRAYKNKKHFNYYWVSYCVVQIIKCLTELGRYQEAIQVARDAEQVYVDSPDFPCLRANVYMKQNRLDDAKEVLEGFLQQRDRYPRLISSVDFVDYWPYQQLGFIYESLGDTTRAVEHYGKAMSLNPSVEGVRARFVQILSQNSSPDEFYQFVSTNPQMIASTGQRWLVSLLLSLGRGDHAEHFLKDLQEDELLLWGFRAKAQFCRGDLTGFRMLIPDDGKDMGRLAVMSEQGCFDLLDLVLYAILDQKWHFLETLHAGLSDEGHRRFVREVLDHFSEGKGSRLYECPEYITFAERCLVLGQRRLLDSLLPTQDNVSPDLLLSLGHLLYRYGEFEKAFEVYRRISLDDYDDLTYVNLVTLYRRVNDPESALRYALVGLQAGHADFRLFKEALELLDSLGFYTDLPALAKMAKEYYPDSHWIEQVGPAMEPVDR